MAKVIDKRNRFRFYDANLEILSLDFLQIYLLKFELFLENARD